MTPTLKEGSRVVVNRLYYLFTWPQAGDIVAIKKPGSGEVLIKRISRVEGKIFFVLGDNKKDSIDSRKFGMLEKKDIIGKIVYYA